MRQAARKRRPGASTSSDGPLGPDSELAGAQLHELQLPRTVWEKLRWIESRRGPDYLELAGMQKTTFNGSPSYG